MDLTRSVPIDAPIRGIYDRPVLHRITPLAPTQAIDLAQPGSETLVDERRELLPQGEILEYQRAPRTGEETDRPHHKLHQEEHFHKM